MKTVSKLKQKETRGKCKRTEIKSFKIFINSGYQVSMSYIIDDEFSVQNVKTSQKTQ